MVALLTITALTLSACGGDAATATPAGPAQHITVQHILISFQGAGTAATRTQAEAKTLATDIFDRAKKGEDFDKLVTDFTDDSPPGIYKMANSGIAPTEADEYSRDGMVPAFGNVGFALNVGEIGMADYDPTTSPYGWHIIKRIK
jgi:peptidyl-prolyl cis-trans isomerase C/foldase protein PrsA